MKALNITTMVLAALGVAIGNAVYCEEHFGGAFGAFGAVVGSLWVAVTTAEALAYRLKGE